MPWKPTLPVVVPIDFSDMSARALATAAEAAEDLRQLYVVHVATTLDPISYGPGADDLLSSSDSLGAIREHLRVFLQKQGLKDAHQIVLEGRAGQEIAGYAGRINAGLIVIPSHGYHGVKRLLMGSVTEQVVRLAHCPILVVRRDHAE